MSECVDLYCASSLKTANALHALVGYRAGTVGYFLSSLKQSVMLVGRREALS